MQIPSAAKLALSILISQSAGIIGSVFTASSIPTWYQTLSKPSWNPPSWVFGPVWITLYTLMGIAAYLVWKKGLQHKPVKTALVLFLVQLVLNAVWSILFFGFQHPGMALAEIVLLWIAIVATIFTFSKHSKPAAILLVPYLLWVSFAAYLNYTIYALN